MSYKKSNQIHSLTKKEKNDADILRDSFILILNNCLYSTELIQPKEISIRLSF